MTHIPARQPEGVPTGGQFAAMTKSEATGVVLGATEEFSDQWIREHIERRDEMREILVDAPDADTPEMKQLDRVYQHASLQLAAAAVLRDYPDAATLVVRENEDGENQYDPLVIRDAEGNDLANTVDDDDWTREEIGALFSPQLNELCWALNTKDDGWADGVGKIREDVYNGKTATINLRKAVEKVAPPRSPAAVAAAEQYAAAQEQMERIRQQVQMVQEVNDHASMQLVAAGILDKYPGASRLNCIRDIESNGRLEVVSVFDGEGNVLADADEDMALSEDDLLGGQGPSVRTLMQNMDPDNLNWLSNIGEVHTNRYQTRVHVDLNKAMNQEAPDDERLKDPRTRPLTAQQQSDLVTASEFGRKQIDEEIAGAENRHHETWLKDLATRTDDALRR